MGQRISCSGRQRVVVRRLAGVSAVLASVAVGALSPVAVEAVTCPTIPPTVVGEQKNLAVKGWVIGIVGTREIYKCSINDWTTNKLLYTAPNDLRELDVSGDGKWVLAAVKGGKCYLIPSAGGVATEVPVTVATNYGQEKAQFLKKSPFGNEIFYNKGLNDLEAIKVDLSGAKPTFGTKRIIAQGIKGKCPPKQVANFGAEYGFSGEISACGNHIYSRVGFTGRHITIPDGGKGIATNATMHPVWDEFGCSLNQSPDGKLVITISAGSMDQCGPGQHKGFIIGDFLEYNVNTDCLKGIDWVAKFSKTIAWCPKEYRYSSGTTLYSYKDVEFFGWYWAVNNADWVVGTQRGATTPIRDLWLVNWKTNVWTRVTFGNKTINEPVVWIDTPGTTEVSLQSAKLNHLKAVPGSFGVYRIDGRLMGTTASPRHAAQTPGVYVLRKAGRNVRVAVEQR